MMVIDADMTNSKTFEARFTVNRNGVTVDIEGRRVHLKSRLLLAFFPVVQRFLLCAK